MKRRSLLAAVGSGLVAVSGCTADGSDSDDGASPVDEAHDDRRGDGNGEEAGATDAPDTAETDDRWNAGAEEASSDPDAGERHRYEECSREVVQYEHLPNDLRAEVDAALDGPHAADEIVLEEAMDVEESYVSVDDRFYRPDVSDTGSTKVLALEHVQPKAFPDPRPVTVGQFRASDLTVTVTVVAEQGDVLLEETRMLAPDAEVEVGSLRRAGVHDVQVTVEKAGNVVDEATASARIDVSHRSVDVTVGEEISVGGAVAYVIPCNFDADR